MNYQLYIGDEAYSSWSLRAWLLFKKFNIPHEIHRVQFSLCSVSDQLDGLSLAQTVPVIITPDLATVADSLAIAEELAFRHPELCLWPENTQQRALARTLTAEMHSSFFNLRSECPMNLFLAYNWQDVSEGVLADLSRMEKLWQEARQHRSGDGPWLFGDYSIVDAFFAPVAARIAGYSLPVSDLAQIYVQQHLSDASFKEWRQLALTKGTQLKSYEKPYQQISWP